jgi:hypothetical protein
MAMPAWSLPRSCNLHIFWCIMFQRDNCTFSFQGTISLNCTSIGSTAQKASDSSVYAVLIPSSSRIILHPILKQSFWNMGMNMLLTCLNILQRFLCPKIKSRPRLSASPQLLSDACPWPSTLLISVMKNRSVCQSSLMSWPSPLITTFLLRLLTFRIQLEGDIIAEHPKWLAGPEYKLQLTYCTILRIYLPLPWHWHFQGANLAQNHHFYDVTGAKIYLDKWKQDEGYSFKIL